MNIGDLTNKIRLEASALGFDVCGICKAEPVDDQNREAYQSWLTNNCHGEMSYMANNKEKRLDPALLVEGAKSVVMAAINYYPHQFQHEENPQFAYYAYGKDYHDVVKGKLKALYDFCQSLDNNIAGRYFCDTAPLFERYWAARAGLGWIGKNSLLIIPKRGSFFFLGALILNTELVYDDLTQRRMPDCVSCTRCIDACPTQAIIAPRIIDSNRCLSYQTIENKGEIAPEIIPNMSNRLYGCDICQKVCPWNRFAVPHTTEEFKPLDDFLTLTEEKIENMEVEDYQRIFKGSAVKRAKLSGLKRNIRALRAGKK